jgi:trans-aconitate methyltransferase
MTDYEYVLDNTWKAAQDRLAQLEATFDAWSIRNLGEVGVDSEWKCLELAAGGGSIAAWLCRRVGPSGQVVAMDLEPRLLGALAMPNLRVQRHNILTDPLPESTFDLVHARALLTFLPEPKQVIRKMVSALKPGGWLLLEEPDYISAIPDPSMAAEAIELSTKGWDALLSHLRSKGYDTALGRHLYYDVIAAGLTEVKAEGFVPMQLGGTATARFWRITFEQVQSDLLAARLLTESEAGEYIRLLESSEYRWLSPTVMSVWGRRQLAGQEDVSPAPPC